MPLLVFGQNAPENNGVTFVKVIERFDDPGTKEKMLGKFLPFLQELCNFTERCNAVTLNLIQRAFSSQLTKSTFKNTRFTPARVRCIRCFIVVHAELNFP
mmetsp:Transcript_10979/g.15110  ORF Transcript_10979/g.15110 Transcript_10979/m.15110 type:complete len:100 (+) Transcript_10979:359-658(+)